MDQRVTPSLRRLFLAHFIIAALVGLQHLFAPRWWTDLPGTEINETVTWRLIGAALVALAIGSWIGYRESNWGSVRVVVIVEIIWSYLGALVIFWGLAFENLPPLEWIPALLLAGFAAAFTTQFMRLRKGRQSNLGEIAGEGDAA